MASHRKILSHIVSEGQEYWCGLGGYICLRVSQEVVVKLLAGCVVSQVLDKGERSASKVPPVMVWGPWSFAVWASLHGSHRSMAAGFP